LKLFFATAQIKLPFLDVLGQLPFLA
jgi:hypothetical protein